MVEEGDQTNKRTLSNLDWAKNAPLCKCPDKERVLYFCTVKTCPARQVNPFYCQVCLEESRHDHGVVKIEKSLADISKKLGELRESIELLVHKCKANVSKYIHLLSFLDQEYVPQYCKIYRPMGEDSKTFLDLPQKAETLSLKLE